MTCSEIVMPIEMIQLLKLIKHYDSNKLINIHLSNSTKPNWQNQMIGV